MDSRGWIPIPLIASFNRVRTLTTDVRLVKDVLILSNIVEVKHDWVRMGGNQWEQFVLPDAPTSSVESRDAEYTLTLAHEDRRIEGDADGGEVEGEVEDEDDDDVVFVMGRDVEDPWTAGRRQT
jgi:la-related protein 1